MTAEVNFDKTSIFVLSILNFEFLNSSLKEEAMKNIHNRNVAELAHYIIVFFT